MMRRVGTFLATAAALALVCGVAADATAGKPVKKPGPEPVTQPCVLNGDASGGGEVGVSVTAYGNLEMTVLGGPLGAVLPAAPYSGIGRVLKDNKRSRLDFAYNDDGLLCRLPESSDGPPPIFDPEVCRYRLILEFGLYERKSDLVRFELPTSRARLWDFTQELNEDGYLDPISTGQANLDVQFE